MFYLNESYLPPNFHLFMIPTERMCLKNKKEGQKELTQREIVKA